MPAGGRIAVISWKGELYTMTQSATGGRETLVQKILLVLIVIVAAALIILSFTHKKMKRDYHWTREDAGVVSQQSGSPEIRRPDTTSIYSLLSAVSDPELDIDIVSLGLINDVAVNGGRVKITMTLTTPSCPYVPEMIGSVKKAVFTHPGVERVDLHISLDPPWTFDRVSPEAKEKLLKMFQHREVSHE